MAPNIFSRPSATHDPDEGARPNGDAPVRGGDAEQADEAMPIRPDAGPDEVDRVIASWRDDLVRATGAEANADVPRLTLTQAHPGGLAQLHADHTTRLSNLLREGGVRDRALSRARQILARATALAERHGVAPVHLAIGHAAWTEDGKRVSSPAILRRVLLEEDGEDVLLTVRPGMQVAPGLVRALAAHGVSVDLGELTAAARTIHGFSPSRALAHLRALGAVLERFDLREEVVLGLYEHPAAILLREYEQTAPLRRSHVVRALAGSAGAAAQISSSLPAPDPTDRDPWRERGVGDLSPRQLDVVEAVASGHSLLIDTPQGSDDLTVLASLLADAAASGRTTLHIGSSPSRGARLEERLDDLGVGEVIMRVDGAPGTAGVLRQRLQRAMTDPGPVLDQGEVDRMRSELVEVRTALSAYTTHLHRPFHQFGVSAFDALQVLTDLTNSHPSPRTRVRLREETLLDIARDQGERARTLLHRAATLQIFTRSTEYGAWAGAVVNAPDHVEDVLARVERLSGRTMPLMRVHMATVAAETGLTLAPTFARWEEQLAVLEGVREVLEVFHPAVFERSAADMVIATASPKWRREHGIRMKRSQRARLVRTARSLLRPGRKVDDLHRELLKVQAKRELWRKHCGGDGWPVLPEGLDEIISHTYSVKEDLARLAPVLATSHPDLERMELNALTRLVDRLAQDPASARELPTRIAVLKELTALGLEDLVADLRHRHVAEDMIDAELDLAWWASILGLMLAAEPRLGGFDPARLEEMLERGRRLDREQVASLAPQTLQGLWRARQSAIGASPAEAVDLEAALRDHASAADLYARHELVRRLVPVVSTVASLVPWLVPHGQEVDLVVLDDVDDSSLPELVPILARARQVVVLGDVASAREGGPVEALARILPHARLDVRPSHLNDQVARLLAHHGIEHTGVPVPWTNAVSPIRVVFTEGTGMPAPGSNAVESTQAEVDAVVDLVVAHALDHPQRSLAVVALNTRHADRVRERIERTVEAESGLASFFRQDVSEPFVVVDPKGARGLRRDRILLTVGFGKTPHGRVLHDFGVLSTEAGVGAMSDVLRTVRTDLTLVSSLRAEEIDRSRLATQGAQMLVDLLDIAEGEADLDHSGWPILEAAPDRLLVDMADRLYGLGLEVVPNVGVHGGMRIPLAIGHPEVPGRLLVAVLTDDDAYVAEPSLRVRDRLWPALLEAQGWTVHTALSMAVFIDPRTEADEIVHSVLDAVDEVNGVPEVASVEAPAWVEDEAELDPEFEAALARADDVRERADELTTGMLALDVAHLESSASARGPRPPIARGLPLAAYGDDQLDELAEWVRSDGVERSVDEMVEELRLALGLTRRGAQSDAVLANVVRRTLPRDE